MLIFLIYLGLITLMCVCVLWMCVCVCCVCVCTHTSHLRRSFYAPRKLVSDITLTVRLFCFPDDKEEGDGNCDDTNSDSMDETPTLTCSGCGCTSSSGQSSGTITDGSGDDNYDSNENCNWLFRSAETIRLSFTSFDTEFNYDFVTINECTSSSCCTKTQLAKLSGSDVPSDDYTSSTGYLQVVFTSDSSVEKSGFEATWEVNTSSGIYRYHLGLVNLPISCRTCFLGLVNTNLPRDII